MTAALALVPNYAAGETMGSDPSFGGGQVIVDINGGMDQVVAIALQPDGRILVTGIVDAFSAAADAMVLRFTTDGALDPTFGTEGKVRLAYGGRDSAGALAVQPDGKVLVAIGDGGGDCVNFPRDCTGLVRLNPDGQLDPTFMGTHATSRNPSAISFIRVLADGRILLVGSSRSPSDRGSYFAARLLANGLDDTSFGTSRGFTYADFGTNRIDEARAGAVQTDGKILIAGSSEGTPALARLTADGLADPTFGANGQVLTTAGNESTTAMGLLPDGRIVVMGRIDQGATLARYRPDGSLDATFGRGGIVGRSPTDPKGKVSYPTAMTLDASGRILVAGNDSVDRYLPSGALDIAFSAIFAAPGSGANSLTAMASSPDGRLVVAGMRLPSAITNDHWDVLVARSIDGEAIGYLDAAVSKGGGVVSVWGWAIDRDAAAPVTVRLYADGSFRQAVTATTSRPDIGTAFPGAGDNHGFEVDLPLGAGNHSVCAELVNQGVGANRWLGCQAAIISPNPYGLLESASRGPGGVAVAGWAIDPDTPGVVSVQMYVDGWLVQTVPASQFRPEVGTSAPASGNNHGFRSVVPAARGSHQVCAYVVNQGPGTSQIVGCRKVVVTVDPIGALDEAISMGGQVGVGVAGWAIDPDVAGPVTVFFTSDGVYVGSVVADLEHAGLVEAVPNYGPYHGFNAFLPGPQAGSHNVCAFALNQGAGTHSLLGCKQG